MSSGMSGDVSSGENGDANLEPELVEQVQAAHAEGYTLVICGGGSKRAFFDRSFDTLLDSASVRSAPFDHVTPSVLYVAPHCGIVSYEPTELVLTARAGTSLAHIEATLAAAGQMLPFEPPRLGAGATLGGTVACGWSGPRRPWGGAVRDALLGVRLINGAGELLTFGGQVMKNVAGYDVARLQAGARGTLGVLTQISVKLLPLPEHQATQVLELDVDAAHARVIAWNRTPMPLSATCHVDGKLYVRCSGADAAVAAAAAAIGGEALTNDAVFWDDLREQRHPFFADLSPTAELWRFSLPPAAKMPQVNAQRESTQLDSTQSVQWLIEWAGAQRWLRSEVPIDAQRTFGQAAVLGGHAQRWQPSWLSPALPAAVAELQTRLQRAFDPLRILNPALSAATTSSVVMSAA